MDIFDDRMLDVCRGFETRMQGMERTIEGQNAMIVGLSSRVGYLEQELADMGRRVDRLGRPEVVVVPQVIDLTEDNDETDVGSEIGGPIEGYVRSGGTPPTQREMELMRHTPVPDEANEEGTRAADLLVYAGLGLPEYEDPPLY